MIVLVMMMTTMMRKDEENIPADLPDVLGAEGDAGVEETPRVLTRHIG